MEDKDRGSSPRMCLRSVREMSGSKMVIIVWRSQRELCDVS